MSAVLAGPVLEHWDWPQRVSPEFAQRCIDVHGVRLLEGSPPEFWRAFQEQELRALLAHARQASAWWRQWLQAAPAEIDRADLAALPILQRTDFRASVESAGALPLPTWHGNATPHSTSGSSGTPIHFFVSGWSGRMIAAHYNADPSRHGMDIGQPMAALLGRFPEHPDSEHKLNPPDPLRGTGPIYARRSIGRGVAEHARWLEQIDPVNLHTAPTVLSGMLEAWETEGVPVPERLRHILTIGETVWPELRAQARRVLGARILDRYTCEEIGPIALQCPVDDERYHVCVSNTVVEVVDDAGVACAEGVAGSVLVTGLHQWASPVVRYELGDIARLHTGCTCGARVPSLSGLLGRKRFLLRLPTGERVFMQALAKHWTAAAPVRQYRLVQTSEFELRAEVMLDRALADDERAAIVAMLRERISPAFSYVVRQVDAIETTPSSKRQELICLI